MNRISRRSILTTAFVTGLLNPASRGSISSSQRNPDAAAMEYLVNDDTAGAMAVWSDEYERDKTNEDTLDEYFTSSVIHGLRSLDKGDLDEAQRGYEVAAELLPNDESVAFTYLADALYSFVRRLGFDDMEDYQPQESTEAPANGYLTYQNWVGAPSTVLIMSADNQFPRNLDFREVHRKAPYAYRFRFKPLSSLGFVSCRIGTILGQPDCELLVYHDDETNQASWMIAQVSLVGTNVLLKGTPFNSNLNKWHLLEVRITGTTVEVWIDYTYRGTMARPQNMMINTNFGVALKSNDAQASFSSLFDDRVIYQLRQKQD